MYYLVKKMMYCFYYDKFIKLYLEGYFESEYMGLGGDGFIDDIIIFVVEVLFDECWLVVGFFNGCLVIFYIDGCVVFDEFVFLNLIEYLVWLLKLCIEYLVFV